MTRKNIYGYNFIKKIGEGNFSDVWKARKNNENFAIKIFKENDEYVIKEELQFLELFFESKYVCNIIEYFSHERQHYIVLEYLGQELLWLIENYKKNDLFIPPPIVLQINKQITEGLVELYDLKLLHTDLKPENILLQTELTQLCFSLFEGAYIKNIKKYTSKTDDNIISENFIL